MSNQTKARKPVKLATQSDHAAYFMPMLESFAEHGELNEVIKNCVVKSCELLDAGVPLFPNDFDKRDDAGAVRAEYEACSAEELESVDARFSLAGRMVSSRSFGKVIFFHLQDRSGRIQCYAERAALGDDAFKVFKKLDVGDIVGVTGALFRTKTGELTLKCDSVRLLSKSFRPLPDKHYGLTNVELRYRQRYVDLIVNPRARDIFRKRSRIVREFRRFMELHGFMEVETPLMHPLAGGAAARPFVTHHNALDIELYLRIAPELYLKRLIVGMDFTEQLFAHIALEVCGGTVITYQGQEINLTPGCWRRLTFHDSLEEVGGHKPEFYNNASALRDYLKARGEKEVDNEGLGKLQAKLFDLDVEPKLIQPTFIYFYPAEISPLARRNDDNPELTDRFELFICGGEMANAFSELNDPVDQRCRFEDQMAAKAAGDEDYLRALEYGMPPTAGQGVGIDRLVMLLTDSPSIREVLFFPLLRPEV